MMSLLYHVFCVINGVQSNCTLHLIVTTEAFLLSLILEMLGIQQEHSEFGITVVFPAFLCKRMTYRHLFYGKSCHTTHMQVYLRLVNNTV